MSCQGHSNGFHPVHNIERKASKRLHLVGESTYRSSKQHPGPTVDGQKFGHVRRKISQQERERYWAIDQAEARQRSKIERNLGTSIRKTWR